MRSWHWRDMDGPDGSNYYASVRRAGGGFLLIVASVLVLADVVSTEYAVDNIALGLLLSTGLGLLGLDTLARRFKDRD